MISKIIFITLAVFLALSSAQDCNNPLLTTFGITGESTPINGTGLGFCPNLQTDDSCCSNITLQGLQADLDNTSAALNQIAAERDTFLAQTYFNVTNDYTNLATQLQALDSSITNIQNTNPTIGNPLRAQANLYATIASNLQTNDAVFSSNFTQFQQARTLCWTTLLQIQSSAWCLACDPNYASLGVQPDGTVNAGPAVCSVIQATCAPYLFANLQFNALIQAHQTLARLNNTVAWLNAYAANNNTIPQDFAIDTPVQTSANATEKTVTLPQGCSATSCPWQCNNLFTSSFALNQNIAANGAGIIGGADVIALQVIGIIVVPIPEGETSLEEAVLAAEEANLEAGTETTAGAGAVPGTTTEAGEGPTEEVLATEEGVSVVAAAANATAAAANATAAAANETAAAANGTLRMLDEDGDWRFLQSGTWNPALNDTGFNVTVETDPANVNNQGEITTPSGNSASAITVMGAVFVILASWLIHG